MSPPRLALFLPIVNLLWIVFFLSDYNNVWVEPEAHWWRGYLSENHTLGETLRSTFNWPVFEVEPRLTRPLSSGFEILDSFFRKELWRILTPHPTLSLTFL